MLACTHSCMNLTAAICLAQACIERGLVADSPDDQREALNAWISISTSFKGELMHLQVHL